MSLVNKLFKSLKILVPLAAASILCMNCSAVALSRFGAPLRESGIRQETREPERKTLEKLLEDRVLKDVDFSKIALKAPQGDENKVTDLSLVKGANGKYFLLWSYKNLGDYNQDGIVDIADITPIAQHYNENVNEYNEWIDGNKDGRIGISDVTAIAQNYFADCTTYRFNPEPLNWVKISRIQDAVNDGKRKKFRVSEDEFPYLQPGQVLYVVPFDRNGLAINAPTSNMVRVQGLEHIMEIKWSEFQNKVYGELQGWVDTIDENHYAEIILSNWNPHELQNENYEARIEPSFDHGFLDWAWDWSIDTEFSSMQEAKDALPTKANLTISVYQGRFNENTYEYEKGGKLLFQARDFVNFIYSED